MTSEGDDRPGVFLDFAEIDRQAAWGLDAHLRRRGIRTAVDHERLVKDGIPDEQVLQDLGACDLLVVIWSAAAATDHRLAVHRELAESFGKPWLVFLLDDAAPPPGASRVLHARDAAARDELLAVLAPVSPPPELPSTGMSVGPGHWTIERDTDPGMALHLHLADDGQVTGTQRQADLTGDVTGTWRFDPDQSQLALDVRVRFGLRPAQAELELQLLGVTDGRFTAEDVRGLAAPARYTLRRS